MGIFKKAIGRSKRALETSDQDSSGKRCYERYG